MEQLLAHPCIKVAAITDHNTVKGFYKVRELASAHEDILIIPGIEVSTVDGDLLLLGAAEVPPEPWTVEKVIDFARDLDCVVVAAHPYREFGLGELTKKYKVDAIEVLNAGSSPHSNALAEDLAKTMGLPGVAGSDAHQADELWRVYNEIQAGLDLDDILKAIKKGFVKVVSAKNSIRF